MTSPALVEAYERVALAGEVPKQDRRDEKFGDDEEDVDADEAAGEDVHARMEQDYRNDGDGAEAIDLAPVVTKSLSEKALREVERPPSA